MHIVRMQNGEQLQRPVSPHRSADVFRRNDSDVSVSPLKLAQTGSRQTAVPVQRRGVYLIARRSVNCHVTGTGVSRPDDLVAPLWAQAERRCRLAS